jgi:hypothetical protein
LDGTPPRRISGLFVALEQVPFVALDREHAELADDDGDLVLQAVCGGSVDAETRTDRGTTPSAAV